MKNTRAINAFVFCLCLEKPILTVFTQNGFLAIQLLTFFLEKKDIICIKSCIGVHVVKFQNNYKTNGPAHSLILWIICQRIKRDRKQEKINSV